MLRLIRCTLMLVAAALLGPAAVWAQNAAPPPSRGALLYETHCIACHSTQMHWRNNKVATDWPSLRREVRRWQRNASLDWSDNDIDEVAHHLNERYYRFAPGGPVVSLMR